MSLFCEYITETDKKESSLYKELKGIYNNETKAEIEYNFIHSPQFKAWFGDWKTDWSSKEKSIDSRLVNAQGEPRLFVDAYGEGYYQNNSGEKMYISGTTKWENEFSSEERTSIVESFSFFFFNNFLKNDAGFVDRDGLETLEGVSMINEAIRQFILIKQNEFAEDPDKMEYLNEIASNILAVRNDIVDYFRSKKIVLQEEEVEEDEKVAEFNTKESFTVNTKDRAPSNIKMMLSFIPKINDNGSFVMNEKMNEPQFVSFDRIWGLLESNLANLSPYKNAEGKIVSVFDQMFNKIIDLVEIEPSLVYVLDILQTKENDKNFQNMFVQAFFKSKKNFVTTIVSGAGSYLNYKIINSQVNTIQKDIVRTWEAHFYTNPNSAYNFEKGKLNLDKVKSISEKSSEVRKSYGKASAETQFSLLRGLFDSLGQSFGINISDKAIRDIMNKNKTFTILDDIDYFMTALKRNPTLKKGSFDINPFVAESRGLLEIAEFEAKFVPEYTENTVLGKNGMYWGYSNTNYMDLILSLIKNGEIEELKKRANLPFYENSIWIQQVIEAVENNDTAFLDKLQIRTFNNFKKELSGDEGEDNKSIGLRDAVNDNIAKTFKEGGPILNMLEPADKGSFFQIEGFNLIRTGTASIKTNPVTKEDYVEFSDETALNYIVDYFRAEYRRMAVVYKEVTQGIKNPIMFYHTDRNGNLLDEKGLPAGNGFKSALFPELSPSQIIGTPLNKALKLFKDNGEPIADDLSLENVKDLKRYIRLQLGKTILKDLEHLKSLGIVDASNKSLTLPTEALSRFEDTANPVLSLVAQYSVNGIIANIETTQLFIGDPAYYKDMVDLKKRVPASYTDGAVMNVTEENAYYNAAIIKDYERGSTFFMRYLQDESNIQRITDEVNASGGNTTFEEVKSILEDYKGTNQADAQAYITPERFKTIMNGLGKWSDDMNEAFDRIMSGKGTVEDYKVVAKEPLKGVYFSVQNGKPTYLKYSQSILWPRLVSGTELEKLSAQMKKQGVDEVIFESGAKVGAVNPTEIHDFETGKLKDSFELVPMKLDSRFWKLQQDLKSKGMKPTDVGSQIQKNILANILLEEDYDGITGEELINRIINTVRQLSDIGVREIERDLGIVDNKITDLDKLKNIIISEARDQGENVVKALEKDFDLDTIFQIRKKIVPIIFSYIKKRASKIQSNGGSYIQMSSFGLDKMTKSERDGIFWLQDPDTLKAPHIDKDGKLKPGEVLISHSMIQKYIPNYRSLGKEELLSRIDEEILELVGYRIPNQGLSSNDVMKVVGILPEEMGDTIVPYTEITMKTGSDFDIDKMYIMVPNVKPIFKNRNRVIKEYLKENFKPVRRALISAKLLDKNSRHTFNELVLKIEEILDSEERIVDGQLEVIISNIESAASNNEDASRIAYINHNGNSKLALQNRLLHYYKTILKDKKSYLEMMTSIDKNTKLLKDHINELHGQGAKSGLSHFSAVEELILKDSLQSGKNGVGVTANNLVDHPLAQIVGMGLSIDLGDSSNKDGGYTSLAGIFNKGGDKKIRITQMISAFLNGFVDIAKDPWIIRGNYTDYTSPTAFLLLRAGFDYKFVNAFIGQPIIKDYSRLMSIANSKTGKKLSSGQIFTQLRKQYSGGKDVKEFVKSIKLSKFKELKYESLIADIQGYRTGEISSSFGMDQIKVLELFKLLKNGPVKDMQYNIAVSKGDVNGPGSSIGELYSVMHKFAALNTRSHLTGFQEKMNVTPAGIFFTNSILLTNSIMKGLLIEFSPVFANAPSAIATLMGVDDNIVHSADFITFIHNQLYGYILANHTVLKEDNIARLFQGSDSVAARISKLKTDDRFKNNFFISNLSTKYNPLGNSYVGIQNTKNQPVYFRNEMSKGWRELMFSEDPEIRRLANDLVLYAFYSTGFSQTLNSFHNFVPHEWAQLSGFNNDVKVIKSEVLNKPEYDYGDFYKFLVKTNPTGSIAGRPLMAEVKAKDKELLLKRDSALRRYSGLSAFIAEDKGMYVYTVTDIEGSNSTLTSIFKAVAAGPQGEVLYVRSTGLGVKEKGNYINEYNPNKISIHDRNNKGAMPGADVRFIIDTLGFGEYIPDTSKFLMFPSAEANSMVYSYNISSVEEKQKDIDIVGEIVEDDTETLINELRDLEQRIIEMDSESVENIPEVIIARNMPKITPESARKETGTNVGTKSDINPSLLSKEGVSVERAAEMVSYELDQITTIDLQDIRNVIIDILQVGKNAYINQFTQADRRKEYEQRISEINDELSRRASEQVETIEAEIITEEEFNKTEGSYSWARTSENNYEVSSKGDKRFSALYAKLKDGRTIEEAYQLDIKGYRVKGDNWKLGKGKKPLRDISYEQQWQEYKALWEQYLNENPDLEIELRQNAKGKTLTDMFASTDVSQARALAELLNERPEKSNAFADVVDDMYDYVNHSGGAVGSDSAWDDIGKELGIRMSNKHYYYGSKTPRGNVNITKEQFEEGKEKVLEANKTLNRRPEKYMNLLARNWMQVKNADTVFAIGKLANNKIVDGGTGWAVQMAVDAGKPVYLFNQKDNSWYVREPGSETFVIFNGIPTLTKNFAGIGTREISKEGLQAIRDVYNKTLGPWKPSPEESFEAPAEDNTTDITALLLAQNSGQKLLPEHITRETVSSAMTQLTEEENSILEEEAKKESKDTTEFVTDNVVKHINNPMSVSERIRGIISKLTKFLLTAVTVMTMWTHQSSFMIPNETMQSITSIERIDVSALSPNLYNEDNLIETTEAFHKTKYGSSDYVIVDKATSRIIIKKADGTVLFEGPVITAKVPNKDWVDLEVKKSAPYSQKAYDKLGIKVTPSGSFTARKSEDTHYGGGYLFSLDETRHKKQDGTVVATAFHANLKNREAAFNTADPSDNYMSMGCFGINANIMREISPQLGNKIHIYVIPSNKETRVLYDDYLRMSLGINLEFHEYLEQLGKEGTIIKKECNG